MKRTVSRLKAGGSWDPLIGRFCWWVLDGSPIMKPLIKSVSDPSIPSIEQLGFASSLINNCTFQYENNALSRVIQWENSVKQRSMFRFRLNMF